MKLAFMSIAIIVLNCSTITIGDLKQECLCDLSNVCDDSCCCDQNCSSELRTSWNNQNQCKHSLLIPLCSELDASSVNIYDLHSGLRTILTVIQRLFCVVEIDLIRVKEYFLKTFSSQNVQKLSSKQSSSIINPLLQAIPSINLPLNIPHKNQFGFCNFSSSLIKKNYNIRNQKCKIKFSQIINSNITNQSIINKLSLNSPTSYLITPGISGTTLVALRLFIRDEQIINSSYAIYSNINNSSYFDLLYSYQFMTSNQDFPVSSSIGYQVGSPLQLLFKNENDSEYYRIFNPINLAFRNHQGKCVTNTSTNVDPSSIIQINFLQNAIHSCEGTKSNIYENLIKAFNYVGKIGSAQNKLNDYISTGNCSKNCSQSNSVKLLINYVLIGASLNPQYQIKKVSLKAFPLKNNQATLFIEFEQQDNPSNLFVPSPPTIDAYLPNNFLSPFIVA